MPRELADAERGGRILRRLEFLFTHPRYSIAVRHLLCSLDPIVPDELHKEESMADRGNKDRDDMPDDVVRGGADEQIRGVAKDEDEDEFEDTEDVEEDEEGEEGSV